MGVGGWPDCRLLLLMKVFRTALEKNDNRNQNADFSGVPMWLNYPST